jgi:hypothetical protein
MRIYLISLILVFWCSSVQANKNGAFVEISKTEKVDPTTLNACTPTRVERIVSQKIFENTLITQISEVGTGCFEGYAAASFTLTAKPRDIKTGQVGENLLWSFNTEGVYGAVEEQDDALYRIEMPGVSDITQTYKYFSLYTGKLVASSTTDKLYSLYATNDNLLRHITIETNRASSRQGNTKANATIFIGDSGGVLETLDITRKSVCDEGLWDEWNEGEISINGIKNVATNITVRDISSTTIKFTLHCIGEEKFLVLEIPLTKQGFDEKRAVVKGKDKVIFKKTTYNLPFKRDALKRAP